MRFTYQDLNLRDQRAYSIFSVYKSKNIVQRIIVQTSIQILFLVLTVILSVVNNDPSFLLLTFIFGFTLVYSMYAIVYKFPKSVLQKNRLIINLPREFTFEDEFFIVQRTDPNGSYSEQFKFSYSLIKAVSETKDYMIIEIDGRVESIFFAKSVLSDHQLLELKILLQNRVGKRYLTYWSDPSPRK